MVCHLFEMTWIVPEIIEPMVPKSHNRLSVSNLRFEIHIVPKVQIARGCRAFSGATVVTNARVYYTPRAAAGASGARHSLRPLIKRVRKSEQTSGELSREIVKLCLLARGV